MHYLFKKLKSFLGITSYYDAVKVAIMSLCFFVTLASYTIIKELKDSVFVLMIGQKYLPDVKSISVVVMLVAVLFYNWLGSHIKRHWLLVIYALVYGIGGLVCAYYLNHPVIGLENAVASGDRIFGWIFYLFLEGYAPFVVSVLWAYLNSISHPDEIQNRYVLITVCSKLGGVLSAGLAWLFMSKYFIAGQALSEASAHVYVMISSSLLILTVPLLISFLIYKVPAQYLTGYSEENKNKQDTSMSSEESGSGFGLLFKYPYVLGIFGMIFFWEAVNVIFNYMRLGIGLKEADSMTGFSAFLYQNAMLTHLVGLVIALVGTSSLIRLLGERFALMIIPLGTGVAIISFLFVQTTTAVVATYIFIRALNYSFAYPLREGLYIPTSNAIKFKAKSWIDGLGQKVSKFFGSGYNKFIQFVPVSSIQSVQFGFFIGIISLWTMLAYIMGRRWDRAVKKGEIIGKK